MSLSQLYFLRRFVFSFGGVQCTLFMGFTKKLSFLANVLFTTDTNATVLFNPHRPGGGGGGGL